MRNSFHNGVLTLAFDRPEQLNAVTVAEMEAMAVAVEQGGSDPRVQVIVLTGEGRAFCSGANLDPGEDISASATEAIGAANRLTDAITHAPQPVVAAVRGVVAGVGVSFALACDLILCDDESYFLLAFTRVGLMPDGGSTALVAASVGRARAMRMALEAQPMTATEAVEAGLVSHVWPSAEFEDRAQRVISGLAGGPSVALARTKAAINAATLPDLPQVFSRELEGQLGLLAGSDFHEGRAAFAERRVPSFRDKPQIQGADPVDVAGRAVS